MKRNIIGSIALLMVIIAMVIHMVALAQASDITAVPTMNSLVTEASFFSRVESIIQVDGLKIVTSWIIAAGLAVFCYLMRCRWMKWFFAAFSLYFLFETLRVTVGIFVSYSPTQIMLYRLGPVLFVLPSLALFLTLSILSFADKKGMNERRAQANGKAEVLKADV